MDELLIRVEADAGRFTRRDRRVPRAEDRRSKLLQKMLGLAREGRDRRRRARSRAPTSRRAASSTTARCSASSMHAQIERVAVDGRMSRRSTSSPACSHGDIRADRAADVARRSRDDGGARGAGRDLPARRARARRRHHRRAGQRQVHAGREARRRDPRAAAGTVGDRRDRSVEPRIPAARSSATASAWRRLAGDPGVFVRSMATRGALGGLARGTLDAVDILDAAGFDIVIIETVGVGPGRGRGRARRAHDRRRVRARARRRHSGDQGRHPRDRRHPRRVEMRPAATPTARIADLKSDADARPRDGPQPAWQIPVLRHAARARRRHRRAASTRSTASPALRSSARDRRAGAATIAERPPAQAGEDILRERFARHRDGRVAALARASSARARRSATRWRTSCLNRR